MLDVSDFQRLPNGNAWVRRSDPEVIIAGTADAPLPGRLRVADAVLRDVGPLVAAGVAYLEGFVDRVRFAPASMWALDSVEFGLTGDEPVGELVAHFALLDEDPYGRWSVTFHYDDRSACLSGVGFARRQR